MQWVHIWSEVRRAAFLKLIRGYIQSSTNWFWEVGMGHTWKHRMSWWMMKYIEIFATSYLDNMSVLTWVWDAEKKRHGKCRWNSPHPRCWHRLKTECLGSLWVAYPDIRWELGLKAFSWLFIWAVMKMKILRIFSCSTKVVNGTTIQRVTRPCRWRFLSNEPKGTDCWVACLGSSRR